MKIALIGASGNAGSRILAELSSRGHAITGIARHADKVAALPGVTAKSADIENTYELANLLKGHDVVISSVLFSASNPEKLVAAVKASGVRRYYVVGGAGGLEVAPGTRLIDTPEFPDLYKPEAFGGIAFLDRLKGEEGLDWTYLSPSAAFIPGERTGTFRLGKDQLLSNGDGSSISFEDFAIALANEIETPVHVRQRFTVGY